MMGVWIQVNPPPRCFVPKIGVFGPEDCGKVELLKKNVFFSLESF
jgi:hypothetical protein